MRRPNSDGCGGLLVAIGRCLWMNNTILELRVFLSPREEPDIYRDELVWHEAGLKLRVGPDNDRKHVINYTLPDELAGPARGHVWAHVFLSHAGRSIDPR